MELWYAIVDLLPFEWAEPGSMYFMKNALLAVLVISPLFGILSTMVVHSRMSFFSDALGHSAFTGALPSPPGRRWYSRWYSPSSLMWCAAAPPWPATR